MATWKSSFEQMMEVEMRRQLEMLRLGQFVTMDVASAKESVRSAALPSQEVHDTLHSMNPQDFEYHCRSVARGEPFIVGRWNIRMREMRVAAMQRGMAVLKDGTTVPLSDFSAGQLATVRELWRRSKDNLRLVRENFERDSAHGAQTVVCGHALSRRMLEVAEAVSEGGVEQRGRFVVPIEQVDFGARYDLTLHDNVDEEACDVEVEEDQSMTETHARADGSLGGSTAGLDAAVEHALAEIKKALAGPRGLSGMAEGEERAVSVAVPMAGRMVTVILELHDGGALESL